MENPSIKEYNSDNGFLTYFKSKLDRFIFCFDYELFNSY